MDPSTYEYAELRKNGLTAVQARSEEKQKLLRDAAALPARTLCFSHVVTRMPSRFGPSHPSATSTPSILEITARLGTLVCV